MRAKPFIVFATLVLVLSACTSSSTSDPKRAASGAERGSSPATDVLLLETRSGPVAVSPATGSVLTERVGAVAAPDGSRLYSASTDGGSTILVASDPATGDQVSSTTIHGELDVRVASESGSAVALMEPLPRGVDPWTPVPRSHTTIVVADPTGARDPRRYHLRGNYEPEAFSVEDSRLFLIQYLPAEAPAVYRVTVLDLADGDVYEVHGRFKTAPERMPGIRLRQVFDGTTSQLYTLYTTEPRAYAQDYGSWGNGDTPVTFVHVLNLKKGWAYCAGLPRRFWGEPANAQAIAPSPDGTLLYVVDSMKGAVAVMNTRTLEIERTGRVPLSALGGVRTSAQVSADGRTLYVGSLDDGAAVLAIDTASLEVAHRWPMHGDVSGLGLSADGQRLYVALEDGVAVLDAATGQELTAVPFQGIESILHVGTLGA
ncbi:MAG: YncE family protein [Actinomycetota bacterium]